MSEHCSEPDPSVETAFFDLEPDSRLHDTSSSFQAGPSRPSRRRKAPRGIGGDLVGSMKRGYPSRSRRNPAAAARGSRAGAVLGKLLPGVGGESEGSRLKILISIALIMFLILTSLWLMKLNTRIKSAGGWERLIGSMV